MGRPARAGRRASSWGDPRLSDILAGQPADERRLAELYDLEHDEITEDLAFYGRWAARHPGPALDLGCGSGRLFRALLDGGATRVVGVDGSASLLERAATRIAGDQVLAGAEAQGRVRLVHADVRRAALDERFNLVILAGVIAHLAGPEDAVRALDAARRHLDEDGRLIVDLLGPGGLPDADLPLSVDWERQMGDRRVIRRSRLERREAPEGLHVTYTTLTDLVEADGTIARLPASFRLWYPSPPVMVALAAEAELDVEAAFGTHDQAQLDERSERCIVVLRRSVVDAGMG